MTDLLNYVIATDYLLIVILVLCILVIYMKMVNYRLGTRNDDLLCRMAVLEWEVNHDKSLISYRDERINDLEEELSQYRPSVKAWRKLSTSKK